MQDVKKFFEDAAGWLRDYLHLEPEEGAAEVDVDPEPEPEEDAEDFADDREFVIQTMNEYIGEEQRLGERLDPFQADLYRIPDTGLHELVDELDLTEAEEDAYWAAKDHLARVKVVARCCRGNQRRTSQALKRLYAARASVTPYTLVLKKDPADVKNLVAAIVDQLDGHRSAAAIIEKQVIIDAIQKSTGVQVETDPLDEATKRPRPSHGFQLPDNRFAITYVWKDEGRAILAPDRTLKKPTALGSATVIFDPATGAVEIRGPADEANRVAKRFEHDLQNGGLKVELDKVRLGDLDLEALVNALNAEVKREVWDPADGDTTGMGTASNSVQSKNPLGPTDLRKASGYKDLPANRIRNQQRLEFIRDGRTHSILINLRDGRIWFPQGAVDDTVITYLLSVINSFTKKQP